MAPTRSAAARLIPGIAAVAIAGVLSIMCTTTDRTDIGPCRDSTVWSYEAAAKASSASRTSSTRRS